MLLLTSSTHAVGEANASSCVERCLATIRDRSPPRLLPFADDTGGHHWAFDLRGAAAPPAVVFIDHERAGEKATTPAAGSFAAFLAMAEAG